MKKIAIMLVVLVLSVSVSTARGDDDWQKTCKSLATLAEHIMRNRQNGVSMSAAMEIVGDVEIAQTLVVDAYRVPRFSTPRIKQETINDFRDRAYLMCVEAFRE